MELIVLAGGFFMGAKIGWGTLVYALLSRPIHERRAGLVRAAPLKNPPLELFVGAA